MSTPGTPKAHAMMYFISPGGAGSCKAARVQSNCISIKNTWPVKTAFSTRKWISRLPGSRRSYSDKPAGELTCSGHSVLGSGVGDQWNVIQSSAFRSIDTQHPDTDTILWIRCFPKHVTWNCWEGVSTCSGSVGARLWLFRVLADVGLIMMCFSHLCFTLGHILSQAGDINGELAVTAVVNQTESSQFAHGDAHMGPGHRCHTGEFIMSHRQR